MTGKLQNLEKGKNGEQIITLSVRADFHEQFSKLKGCEVDVTIKKRSKKRSLDANAYCWLLCGKIADVLSEDGITYAKEEVYRLEIREAGVYRDFYFDIKDVETMRASWEMHGIGWLTEIISGVPGVSGSPNDARIIVRCYYGSSVYNTKQMSRLINNIVQDCRALEIPTETPEQIANMLSLWENHL